MSFAPSGRALTEELPEILNYTTTYKFDRIVVRNGDDVVTEDMIIAADSNYFRLFDYPLISGDPETALVNPYSLVLTESKAKAYFGDENALGKFVRMDGDFDSPFQVTGVMKDVPANTHYRFEILMSIKTIDEILVDEAWNAYNYYTYLKIDPKADILDLTRSWWH